MSEYPSFPGVEPFGTQRSIEAERQHRKRVCSIGYRIFAAMRWGQLGDGHISARDPELTDHFWLLDWGVPFNAATVDALVLVGPDGSVKNHDFEPTGAVNTAGFNIHSPVLAARPEAVSAAHTHTQFGTPWAANVEPFRAISQESCAFVFDQAMFDDEEVEDMIEELERRHLDVFRVRFLWGWYQGEFDDVVLFQQRRGFDEIERAWQHFILDDAFYENLALDLDV